MLQTSCCHCLTASSPSTSCLNRSAVEEGAPAIPRLAGTRSAAACGVSSSASSGSLGEVVTLHTIFASKRVCFGTTNLNRHYQSSGTWNKLSETANISHRSLSYQAGGFGILQCDNTILVFGQETGVTDTPTPSLLTLSRTPPQSVFLVCLLTASHYQSRADDLKSYQIGAYISRRRD